MKTGSAPRRAVTEGASTLVILPISAPHQFILHIKGCITLNKFTEGLLLSQPLVLKLAEKSTYLNGKEQY